MKKINAKIMSILKKQCHSIFIILLALIMTVSSCCDENDSSKGAIIEDIDLDYLQFQCIGELDTMVIRDDSTYKAVFAIDSNKKDCKKLRFPEIDFNMNSVLIFPKMESGRYYFHRNVEIDSSNKEAIYSITTTSCHCIDKCLSDNPNIVIVPKIEDDYIVKFE